MVTIKPIITYSCCHYLLSQRTMSTFLNATRRQTTMLAQCTPKPHERRPQPVDIIAEQGPLRHSVQSDLLIRVFLSPPHPCSKALVLPTSDTPHSAQPTYLCLLKPQRLLFSWKHTTLPVLLIHFTQTMCLRVDSQPSLKAGYVTLSIKPWASLWTQKPLPRYFKPS